MVPDLVGALAGPPAAGGAGAGASSAGASAAAPLTIASTSLATDANSSVGVGLDPSAHLAGKQVYVNVKLTCLSSMEQALFSAFRRKTNRGAVL
jgi:hypothetical protein